MWKNNEYYRELTEEACRLFLDKEIDLEELYERVSDFVGCYLLAQDIEKEIDNGNLQKQS